MLEPNFYIALWGILEDEKDSGSISLSLSVYRDGPLAALGPVGDSAPSGPGPLPLQDILQKFMGLRSHSLVLGVTLMEVFDLGLALWSPSKTAVVLPCALSALSPSPMGSA